MEFGEMVTILVDRGWQGLISIAFLRWIYLERKAKKNGNGQSRRLTDKLPGNPGHSPYEAINDRLDGFEHRLERTEDEMKELGLSIARIEVRIENKKGG